MIDKKDLESHVFSTQMIKRGICSKDEVIERKGLIKHLEEMEGFFSPYNDSKRIDISKGVVKRRNAAYKILVDDCLSEKDKVKLERYIYYRLQANLVPEANIITLKLNI